MGNKERLKKGFLLIEVMVAAIILTILATGIMGTIVIQKGMLNRSLFKTEAMNYARSVADMLLNEASASPNYFPKSLGLGDHTIDTDPDICTLPDGYFKTNLNGIVKYTITKIKINTTDMFRVEITVEWKNLQNPTENHSKTLIFGLQAAKYFQ